MFVVVLDKFLRDFVLKRKLYVYDIFFVKYVIFD